MSIAKKLLCTLAVMSVGAGLLTCTKISFDDPFTGEDALAVPIITLRGPNPYVLNVNDTYDDAGATAIDTSGGDTTDISDSIVIVDGAVPTGSPGQYVVKYLARGINGVRAKQERRVVVTEITGPDTEKPVITILGLNPKKLFLGQTYEEAGVTAHDNVDGDVTANIITYGDVITTDKPDTLAVWYMVTDNAGNIARAKREVYIWEGSDNTPPVLTLLGKEWDSIFVFESYQDPGATAIDDIDGDLTDQIVVVNKIDTTLVGTYQITYHVADKAGNTADATRHVWVLPLPDTIPPVITLLGDSVMSVGAGGIFVDPGATAIDNIDGDISSRVRATGTVNMQQIGTYYRYYNVTDNAGNQAQEKRRTVNVVDTIPPTISINPPNPLNLYVGTRYREWGATAWDNLDGNITRLIDTVGFVNDTTNDSVDVFTPGQYRVHYRVTDAAGYTTDSVRIVNVSDFPDTVAPIITLLGQNPMNLEVGQSYVEPGATAWDNKDGDVTDSIKINNDTVNTSLAGVYRVHYRVTDRANNTARRIRTVYVGVTADSLTIGTGTVQDNMLPVAPYYYYSYTQSIYLQSEIAAGRTITIDSIAFEYNGRTAWTKNILVYLGRTTKTAFTTTADWIAVSGMTQVYSGDFAVPRARDWVKIKFTTPFQFNTSNNLVVAIRQSATAYHGQLDAFYCTNLSSYRSIYYRSDQTNPNPSSPPTATNRKQSRPNIRIYYH